MPTAKLHQLKMAATQMSFLSTTSRRCFTVDSVILSPHLPFYTTNSLSFSLIAGKHPHFLSLRLLPALPLPPRSRRRTTVFASTMAPTTGCSQEALPPPLDSTSDPPPIFDGTTRLYISYTCPYAQRVWITRNCKGLQEQIKLVPIDLQNRPAWYKEKVYPANKVPSLEHNGEVRGESLDLIKYIDSHFEGPSLMPNDPAKKVFADVLFSYSDSFHKTVTASFKEEGVKAETDAAFDFMEDALSKFSDGPFFLGQFSLVDIAYIPFFERYIPFFLEMKNCDLTVRRPKLAEWIEEMDKIDGYKQTKTDPKMLVESYKKRFLSKV
uniref:glutathione transferase n=1 Tax=Opuntia streptacantha TaxID=393608 RepID=A0A7C9DNA9_OPUST